LSPVLKGRPIVSGHCKGTALVAKKPISFLGGVDPTTGIIIEKNHDLEGKQLKDTVLCFPSGHGSTVGIEDCIEGLSTIASQPDLVFLGCPHCSLEEIRTVAAFLEERKVKSDLQLWVCTSRWMKEKAKDYVKTIEKAGGHVVCDTCVVVTWLRDLGISSVMTNSAKTAYYAPTMNKVDTLFAPLNECLEKACR